MGERLRIYVGGLGSSVREDDLKKTFSSPHLGSVESVEIIRTKGRSFGYLGFAPASDKGLAKLFSNYNGCMWKGGKLKLEKAKEHYVFRLRREWTEDAELELKSSIQKVDADESVHALPKSKKYDDSERVEQLKLFFPKLRKIKPIPLKGTGKHKYSFQRVEIPPLPIHFCDCEEHCNPLEPVKINYTVDHKTDTYEVSGKELNMMESILKKLLEKENSSETVPSETKLTEQVDDDEDDQVSDEDNLVLNMVGQSSKRVAFAEDWGRKTTARNQDYLVRQPESFNGPIPCPERNGSEKKKLLPQKKRKQSDLEENSNNTLPSKRKGRTGVPVDSIDDSVNVIAQPTNSESVSKKLSRGVASSRKAAWKTLVSEKESTAFHISDVLTDLNPDAKANDKSEYLSDEPCSNENYGNGDEPSKDEPLEKLSDVQENLSDEPCSNENDGNGDEPSKDDSLEKLFDVQSENLSNVQSAMPSAVEDNSGRGVSWRHKSSWLQLIADTNKSAFSVEQILPGVTFDKQEGQQFDGNDISISRNGKEREVVHKDLKSPNEDTGGPEVRGDDLNVDVSTKEPNNAGLYGEQSNSDSKQTFKEQDDTLATICSINLVRNNRPMGESVISETFPFMRSDASMKEWMKAKAALSASNKRKNKGKEPVED